jgi:Integrase core domain
MSREFRRLCSSHGIEQSTGRTGSCHDNSPAESLWASLNRELVSRYRFASRAQARRAIMSWINHYNAVRLHSSLGNMPPDRMGVASLSLDHGVEGRCGMKPTLSDRLRGSEMITRLSLSQHGPFRQLT